jgi:hypothetical protein
MTNRKPLATALALAICLLLLPACAHHQAAVAERETTEPTAPEVTGTLAEVACDDLTPAHVGAKKQKKDVEAPDAGQLEATLRAQLDDDRLRTYLHCLARRGLAERP